MAPPAFLPLPGPQGLHQRGHGLALFFTSRGELTAYSPAGERLWQARARVHGPPCPAASCLPCPAASRSPCTLSCAPAGVSLTHSYTLDTELLEVARIMHHALLQILSRFDPKKGKERS